MEGGVEEGGGCQENLSNERKGLLHRGHTYIHAYGHRYSMTESAHWANSVKRKTISDFITQLQRFFRRTPATLGPIKKCNVHQCH